MKVTQVSITYKRIWQTQQFESLTESIDLVAELEEGDDLVTVTKKLQAQAKSLVNEHARSVLEASGRIRPARTEKLSGLEVV